MIIGGGGGGGRHGRSGSEVTPSLCILSDSAGLRHAQTRRRPEASPYCWRLEQLAHDTRLLRGRPCRRLNLLSSVRACPEAGRLGPLSSSARACPETRRCRTPRAPREKLESRLRLGDPRVRGPRRCCNKKRVRQEDPRDSRGSECLTHSTWPSSRSSSVCSRRRAGSASARRGRSVFFFSQSSAREVCLSSGRNPRRRAARSRAPCSRRKAPCSRSRAPCSRSRASRAPQGCSRDQG